jgi:hypothetical protein
MVDEHGRKDVWDHYGEEEEAGESGEATSPLPSHMPSIAFTSSVATSTGDIALEICITHVLLVGAPSMCVHPVKCSALDKIDITLDPAFTISFAGVANSITVPELDVIKSIPFARLLDSLNRQARELGFLRIYTERASSNS